LAFFQEKLAHEARSASVNNAGQGGPVKFLPGFRRDVTFKNFAMVLPDV